VVVLSEGKTMKTIKVPKKLQSIIKDCPNGGLPGFYVTENKLAQFAKIMHKKYIDEIIPLNNNKQANPDSCKCQKGQNDGWLLDNSAYWETPDGSHGWCCQVCGCVFQWG